MKKFLLFLAIGTFILGSFCIFKGFDKKENYDNPEYSWQDSTNAYVGGDAYNYIINSNYFTGYNVLGIGSYIVTVLSLIGSEILKKLDDIEAQVIHTKSASSDSAKESNLSYSKSEKKAQSIIDNSPVPDSYKDSPFPTNNFNNIRSPISQYYSPYNQQIPSNQWQPQMIPMQNNQTSAVSNSPQTFAQNLQSDKNSEHKTSDFSQSS